MKVHKVNRENRYMLLSADYWEIEMLGYDVIKQIDVTGHFYSDLLVMIDEKVIDAFGEKFNYGVKTYVDRQKACYYYEIKPYDERLDEFILEEMLKNNYSIKYYYMNVQQE